jgi:ABC-type uncharacterized transport system permease subunit
MSPLLQSILSAEFGFAIFRVMTPLLFAAIGVSISQLAGTINISMEGAMLVSAFVGVVVSAFTNSLFLALLAGVASGMAMGAILSYFHLRLKADVILAAMALNIFASGITVFLLYLVSGDKGSSSSLKSLTFPDVHIPLIRSIPVLGTIVSGHNVMTYGAFLAIILFYIITFKTPLGLRIRAVGQNPNAAESVGINVNRTRMWALILSGFFGSFGGLYLSMGYVSWFARDFTAGRGWIAIAAATLGGYMPLGTFLASLLFGAVNALAIYLASLQIPSEFITLIPYAATVIALTIYSAQALKTRTRRVAQARRVGKVTDVKEAGGTEGAS